MSFAGTAVVYYDNLTESEKFSLAIDLHEIPRELLGASAFAGR